MLAASTAPSAAPAPTIMCSSSMNRMTSLEFCSSSSTLLMRSSNSPRYLVPAIMPVKSSAIRRLFLRFSGTSPETIFCAGLRQPPSCRRPGSPTRAGLFLVRRDRIWMTRSISSLRPMTGSSLPSRAALVSPCRTFQWSWLHCHSSRASDPAVPW